MVIPNVSFKHQRGYTCWWLKETPSTPHAPLHSCTLLRTLCPGQPLPSFSACTGWRIIPAPDRRHTIKWRGLSLSWSDLIFTLGINLNILKKIAFTDHFLKKLHIYLEKKKRFIEHLLKKRGFYRTLDGLVILNDQWSLGGGTPEILVDVNFSQKFA